ncbi:hypothetical protein [uncultured Acinetobacter sp.]|uniref:hypothetical protein n=1 Tax=uncultured Acinetobacter sp. TaxID=165433 RepID=UPI0025E3995F|nr:hypothetical protein [uncultured Acinetobacter sp.]
MDDLQNQDTAPVVEAPTPAPTEPTNNGDQQPTNEPQTETQEQKTDLPESADKYEVNLEGFDFDAFKADESNKAFLENALNAGISNEQLGVVLQAYEQHTAVQLEALQSEWGGEFDQNLRLAKQAVEAAGLDPKEIDSPTFGIRLAAHFGKALQEDMPPQNTQLGGGSNITELMLSEAYMNPSHPDHKRVYAQVEKHYSQFNQ